MSEHHRTSEWARVVSRMKPRIAAEIEQGLGQCIDCGGYIPPGTPLTHWQVGHRLAAALGGGDEPENLGPSHSKASGRACNQSNGGKVSQGLAKANKQRDMRLPTW